LICGRVGGITVVNTYVPQGYLAESEKFDYKLNWFATLLSFFERHFEPNDPVVWVGDLNVAPSAIDVYDPVGLLARISHNYSRKKLLALV
jgi:exodeoxyribonuclease-3